MMKPITFKECNATYAKNQPPYLPLPAHKTDNGLATTCWSLSILERLRVLFTGKIYLKVLTFNNSLQPLKMVVTKQLER